jgi:hypothetical protein
MQRLVAVSSLQSLTDAIKQRSQPAAALASTHTQENVQHMQGSRHRWKHALLLLLLLLQQSCNS